jgi:hypothetical protein
MLRSLYLMLLMFNTPPSRPAPSGKGRILGKRLTVGRNHFFSLTDHPPFFNLSREAALDDLKHDPHGGGSAGRSAQHRNDGTVGCADKLRAKLQDAAVFWILLDDLHALARYFDLPILLLRIWKELAERGEPLLWDSRTWPIRYSVRATLSLPTASSGSKFSGSMEPKRSR